MCVTVGCILATNDESINIGRKADAFNSVKSDVKNEDKFVLQARRTDEVRDLGLEDPKGAVDCWEHHGNYYYHSAYTCVVMET
jgi:hypothetical protein